MFENFKKKVGEGITKASSKLGFIPEAGTNFKLDWFDDTASKTIWTGYSESDSAGITDETLYETIKKSPEVVGIIRVLIHDILADGWNFDGNKKKVEDAKLIQEDLEYLKVLSDALWDLFITGDAYILKLSHSPEQIKSIVKEITKDLPIQKAQLEKINIKVKTKTRGLQLLKSSTVKVKCNDFGEIKYFRQKVGNEERKFSPKDIIHLSMNNIGGSVYGFTPLQPLLSDIATLIMGKEYLGKVFEEVNPPIIYNLPDSTSGEDDRNFQLLRKQLEEAKKRKNKLKSMVVTGNLETKQIAPFAPQEQMSDIIKHFTSILLFSWGVPPHRVPFLQTRVTQTPKESDNGYFKSIDFMQDILQAQLNKQLWKEFDVRQIFNKAYRIDELQQATVASIMMDRNAIAIEEAREKVGFTDKLDPSLTLPINMRHQRGSFDSNRDGTETEDNTPPELQDNKIKVYSYKEFSTIPTKDRKLVYYGR